MSNDQIQVRARDWAYGGARVTAKDVEAAIASEKYFTAAEGVIGAQLARLPTEPVTGGDPALARVSFCLLTLRNGTQIAGVNYGAIDPQQHNASQGNLAAREDALRQVWAFLGYELRSRLERAAVEYRIALSTEG